MSHLIDRSQLRRHWENALAEDGAGQDITSMMSIDERAGGVARVTAKAEGIFAGRAIFDVLAEAYENRLTAERLVEDGQRLMQGTDLATIHGPLRLLLSIERTLLNFLQRLCGVATLTRRYVDAVAGTSAKIYDTRKTIPGWRQLDKYAVRCGGGCNHRFGLHDAILIKDNHLAGIGTPRLAAHVFRILNEAASLTPPPAFVEVEVDTLEQFDELLKIVSIDVILIDNFTLEQMAQAVRRRDAAGLRGRVVLEASGGVELARVAEIACTGVERIAVGALTHSAPALDIHAHVHLR